MAEMEQDERQGVACEHRRAEEAQGEKKQERVRQKASGEKKLGIASKIFEGQEQVRDKLE